MFHVERTADVHPQIDSTRLLVHHLLVIAGPFSETSHDRSLSKPTDQLTYKIVFEPDICS